MMSPSDNIDSHIAAWRLLGPHGHSRKRVLVDNLRT